MFKLKNAILLTMLSIYLLLVGCPHRTPVWSPDGKRMLLLGGAEREAIDKPASKLWLVNLSGEGGSGKQASALIQPPEATEATRYLATAWIDDLSFAVLTVRWEAGEAVESSETLWKVAADGTRWSKLGGPPASSERTPRRNPVVLDGRIIVYPTGSEGLAAVALADGKEAFKLEQAEIVGPGPQGGFLIYRPEEEQTGDLELAAFSIGAESRLQKQWSRRFSDLRKEIAAALGKKPDEIVFNDASSSQVGADGSSVAVNLVFTDVNWKDGVSGYLVILSSRDGSLMTASGATCLPGKPALTGDLKGGWWAWAVLPFVDKNNKNTVIRSFPIGAPAGKEAPGGPEGLRLELKDLAKSAIQGYGVSPDRRTFCVAVNGSPTRLLLYPVKGGALQGDPREVQLP